MPLTTIYPVRSGAASRGLLMAALLGASILLPAISSAQQPAVGSITGRVTARDGSGLAHSTVALDDRKQGTVAKADGSFRLDNVPAGKHRLIVSHVGYTPFETDVTVKGGGVERVEIVLDERPAGSAIIINAPRVPYRPQLSSTATKTNTPLIETPASVQILTGERLTEQKVDRVNEMFEYMTGVVQGGGQRAQDYLMRGFAVDNRFIPYQIDGISGGVWRQHEPPAAIIERVEYLKGPNSTLYGITQLGGVINYVTKKPKASPEASIELRHSTYASELSPLGARNSANVAADMTGPIDEEGEFLYRVIANTMNTTTYRDGVEESSLDLLPEMTWNMSPATQLTVSMNVNVDKGKWDEFLPVPGRDLSKIPDLRTRINDPDDSYWDYGWGLGYIARHSIGDDWVIRSVGRHTERIDGRRLFEFAGLKPDNQTMRRNWRDQFNERYYTYFDVTAEGNLETGGISHTLLAGLTIGNERIHFDRRNLQGDSTLDVNIYNPVHEVGPLFPIKRGYNRFWNNVFLGGYLQDQIKVIEQVRLVAGVQYTNASTHHEERQAGLDFQKDDAGFSPRVGLVVMPMEDLSLYGSYSTSFSPTNAERENAEGNLDFEPEIGSQIEGGVKFNLMDAGVGGTVSLFQLDYENALNATGALNPNGNTIYVQSGAARSKGVEIDLYTAPFEGLYITAGYAYTDARVTEDTNAARVGQRLPYVPYNTMNVWATYSLPFQAIRGLNVGLGVVRMDKRPTEFPTSNGQLLMLPEYTRLDGLISYEFPSATLSLNVTNLLDERYFSSGGVSRIIPGTPRTVRTSLQVRM